RSVPAIAAWGPLLTAERDAKRFRQLAGSMPPVCLAAVQTGAAEEDGPLLDRQMSVLHSFLMAMIDHETRAAAGELGRKLNPSRADYRRGYSPLAELWWNGLLSGGQPADVQGSAAELEQLTEEIAEAGGGRPKSPEREAGAPETGSFRLCLRIEPAGEYGQGTEDGEPDHPQWRLTFWAEGAEDAEVLLPLRLIWSYPQRDMEIRGRLYRNVQEHVLLRLAKAAEASPEIAAALEGPRPEGLLLAPEQVFSFLSKSVSTLRKTGVTVQMPSRWTREGRRTSGVRLEARGWAGMPGDGAQEKPRMGVEQLVAFEAAAVLDGREISREELAELAAAKTPLVFFRGEWIEIDNKEIRQVLKFMKRHENGALTFRELMHLSSGAGEALFEGVEVEGIETAGMLSMLIEGGLARSAGHLRPVPPGLNGTLRPYQERGYQWLAAMRELGFGALLADDMGLGKTVQVISVLLDNASRGGGQSLIVCPTSLLGNWQRELSRFAPKLRLYVHHGSGRCHGERFVAACRGCDVILTTYQLAGRDAGELRALEWGTVVLDEAQYIKNFGTKQAQSVMKLSAVHRIAMTGTPVENRLSELWSIFHFLNPGYLGSHASFRARYQAGSGEQTGELQKLRRLVAPFMLRRLKSDPDIRKDLPEKIELKSYCPLSAEQVRLYRSVTEELMANIGRRDGIARKGLVLSSLTRLKQICDHPDLVAERARAGNPALRSGKLERLGDLLDIITDSGEAALIFTQYVRMGELLQEILADRYGERPFFLHGGVAKADRDRMVRLFQEGGGSPLFVLSLKAGGVGLNLTRANHVVHYDRWWNPAVENQATDRVFRIGQEKNVEVHKLICQGTLEERIDELIERKKALSEQVVGSGEQWLTEMSDDELRSLIALQNDGILEGGIG
ncbi:DEAD/DEAH box helicase, partial [Paenibacillus macerans]|uniref:DEAD/DEAH box helicase n=1 Tax=Paenibacillus macerans TaxID=44252 RepID=UPI002DC04968